MSILGKNFTMLLNNGPPRVRLEPRSLIRRSMHLTTEKLLTSRRRKRWRRKPPKLQQLQISSARGCDIIYKWSILCFLFSWNYPSCFQNQPSHSSQWPENPNLLDSPRPSTPRPSPAGQMLPRWVIVTFDDFYELSFNCRPPMEPFSWLCSRSRPRTMRKQSRWNVCSSVVLF